MVLLNTCVTCGPNCPLMVQASYAANPITGTIVAAFWGTIGTNYIALYIQYKALNEQMPVCVILHAVLISDPYCVLPDKTQLGLLHSYILQCTIFSFSYLLHSHEWGSSGLGSVDTPVSVNRPGSVYELCQYTDMVTGQTWVNYTCNKLNLSFPAAELYLSLMNTWMLYLCS